MSEEETFDISRNYQQWEVCEVLGKMQGKGKPIASATFNRSWRTRKGFPKPIVNNKTSKVWSGYALYNWFHKKGTA